MSKLPRPGRGTTMAQREVSGCNRRRYGTPSGAKKAWVNTHLLVCGRKCNRINEYDNEEFDFDDGNGIDSEGQVEDIEEE